MALNTLNPNADCISSVALEMNARSAMSLRDILKTNLGPSGKIKMLVSGAGDITLTKDGSVLLKKMQIEHPTAALIARNAAAQDAMTGDGSTSLVVFIGELLQQSLHFVNEGVHPRCISDGVEIARKMAIKFVEEFALAVKDCGDKEFLSDVARSVLRTKLPSEVADHLSGIVLNSVLKVRVEGQPIDLHMVELVTMEHKSVLESCLVDGLVLDHGFRHPKMPRHNKNCFVLTCNISMEYEKTEVNSQFYFSDAGQRAEMVKAERDHVNSRLEAIVQLKEKVCAGKPDHSFLVVNQKGIDPLSLDFLHRNGIVALRRAKRRNMERLTLAFGGVAVNSTEGLSSSCLGFARSVTARTLGEQKFTFIEGAEKPRSCTVLLRGPNKHIISQMQEAVRDGHRAVKFALEDRKTVPGAAAFEVALHLKLMKAAQSGEHGKSSMGIRAFAEALMVIPRALAKNAGLDPVESLLKLKAAVAKSTVPLGLNLETGEPMSPVDEGVYDNYRAKRQLMQLGSIMCQNFLMVDEVIRAGKV